MANATFAVPHFLGGEISAFAQGRFDKPDYRNSLNVCLNAFPGEIGPWMRCPGTRHAGTTRGGAPGRVMRFDFEQAAAVTIELTDGRIRFRSGAALLLTNDPKAVLAISAATPAVVQTAVPHSWNSEDTVMLDFLVSDIATGAAVLQNRQFIMTSVDATHLSIRDAITGAAVDGSTLGAVSVAAIVERVQELTTIYTGGSWAALRAVQAETTDILLGPATAPQALVVATLPAPAHDPTFTIGAVTFNDGPYLDPFTNGVQATPSAKTGVISITLAFPAYDAAKAYAAGSFVTSSSVNYVSLVDQNVGNTPVSSPSFWAATSASAAVNGGLGFLGTDIGRLVRLYSEPAAWASGSSYTTASVVSYNPTGQPSAAAYYQSQVTSSSTVPPGTDLTTWKLIPQGAAIWTWGKITSLSNIIDRALAGSASIGDMTSGGGNGAAFDGVFSQASAACAEKTTAATGSGSLSLSSFVGKNYSAASDQRIQQAAVYPSNDGGFASGSNVSVSSITLNLRGKATAPASASDGTLLGTSGSIANTFSAVTLTSSDQATAWKYAWVEQVTIATIVAPAGGPPGPVAYSLSNAVAELSLFNPPGTGTSAGVNVEILGPALLYTNPILTWRLGVYSNTTGWPTCGTYDEGRLWLGGVVKNRFDASVSNGIAGAAVNFAPTDQYGAVAANNAISYTLNAKDANPIIGMVAEEAGIIMITQAGEWLVRAPQTGPIAPNNISARRVTKIGGANIEPVRTEHTNIMVQRYGKKLIELFPDAYSGKFTGPNLADKAEHIAAAGIAEIAYVSAATPIIWGRDPVGGLFGVAYKRDTLTTTQPPTYYAWFPRTLGSGRLIESVCAGPSLGGDLDALTMVTNDPATGIRHVEILTDAMDELSPLANAWFLDDALAPASTIPAEVALPALPYGGLTLTGLAHLEGKTVQVFAGGLDCGDRGPGTTGWTDFVVTGGAVTVPYGDSISAGPGAGLFTSDFVATNPPIVVGFTYDSDGQLVRPIMPADSGSRMGPSLGLLRRIHRYALLLVNTLGLSVGTSFDKLDPVPLKQADGETDIAALTTFSGIAQGALRDNDSYDGMICWRVSRPFPAILAAASGNLATKDQ